MTAKEIRLGGNGPAGWSNLNSSNEKKEEHQKAQNQNPVKEEADEKETIRPQDLVPFNEGPEKESEPTEEDTKEIKRRENEVNKRVKVDPNRKPGPDTRTGDPVVYSTKNGVRGNDILDNKLGLRPSSMIFSVTEEVLRDWFTNFFAEYGYQNITFAFGDKPKRIVYTKSDCYSFDANGKRRVVFEDQKAVTILPSMFLMIPLNGSYTNQKNNKRSMEAAILGHKEKGGEVYLDEKFRRLVINYLDEIKDSKGRVVKLDDKIWRNPKISGNKYGFVALSPDAVLYRVFYGNEKFDVTVLQSKNYDPTKDNRYLTLEILKTLLPHRSKDTSTEEWAKAMRYGRANI